MAIRVIVACGSGVATSQTVASKVNRMLGGANEIWLVIILTIPVILIMSFFLPDNQILPFAGIVNISIAVPAYLVCKGNVLRIWIECVIFTPVFLWVGTAFAPFMTELANSTKAIELASGQMISNSGMDAPIFTYAISHAAKVIQGDFLPLVILLVWTGCFVLYSGHLIKEKKEDLAKGSV